MCVNGSVTIRTGLRGTNSFGFRGKACVRTAWPQQQGIDKLSETATWGQESARGEDSGGRGEVCERPRGSGPSCLEQGVA